MQTRALVYTPSLRINERRRQTFKVTLCRFFTCFLCLSWVSLVEGDDCPLKLNPPSVVVEYGSSVSVDCITDVTHYGMGWEASVGPVSMTKDKLVTWRVSNLRQWDIRPQCYINYNKMPPCSASLSITIYKTPDSVSINTVDHAGPMIEGSQYELQCEIVNVAPRNLTVKWFKGETVVDNETFINMTKTPGNVISTHQITANRSDDRAQYRCEVEMKLGTYGPQPPPKVTSEPLNITVHFEPVINETKLHSTVYVIRDDPVVLVCEAGGNPPPEISWSHGNRSIMKTSNGILTLDKVADEAVYTCTAVNSVGNATRKVEVVITGIYIKPVNHTGPMIEGSKYELQCDIVNVASVESLTVKWYKGGTPVHNKTFNDIIKTPVNVTSTFEIIANRSDNGAQYRCEAELELGADGPQPHHNVTSEPPLNITVHYKPVINNTKLPSEVSVIRGYPVVLSCKAEGNPEPEISWRTNPNDPVKYGENLTITEATSQNIVCIANNYVGNDSREVEVILTALVKPVINKTKLPSEVPVFRGYPVVLSCEAEGNPKPEISWKTNPKNLVNGGTLTITEATSQNPVCTASNSVGSDSIKVKVILTEDYLPLIAGLVAITVAVISVIFIFIYSIYYKTAKMGHYSLKDTKHCAQNGNIAQNGKDNTIPMKKLSQSDILA